MSDQYGPISTTGPRTSTKVELSISCKSLPDMDKLSKSDPMAYVFHQPSGNYVQLGHTEWQKNQPNPVFSTGIQTDFYFERQQKLKFVVVDVDDGKPAAPTDKNTIGWVECTLGDIFGAPSSTWSSPLKNEKLKKSHGFGFITIRARELGSTNKMVALKFSGSKLDDKDFFTKSDPFFKIFRSDKTVAYESEVIKNNLNPHWRPFSLPFTRLANSEDEPLEIHVWDWDSDGGHDLIGIAKTTYKGLKTTKTFDLIEPKLQQKKGKKYKNSGQLLVDLFREDIKPS